MMRRIGLSLVAILALSGEAVAGVNMAGRDIVEHGSASGAPPCSACHGAHLEGNDALKAPPLAGKPADYIIARLNHYASPEGHNAMMKQVASALSTAERKVVASYIAHLRPQPPKR